MAEQSTKKLAQEAEYIVTHPALLKHYRLKHYRRNNVNICPSSRKK